MTDPRDHILALSYRGSSTQTDVTKVTCKVRVNGGAATTYTNVSTPAITQNADGSNFYELDIAASTYSDGDRVVASWFYNAVYQDGEMHTIGPAAVDGAHYTNARGDLLGNLDAAISTLPSAGSIATAVWAAGARTLTAFSDSSGITTLLSRVGSALTITGGKVDVNDKTGFVLTSAYDPAKTAAQAGDAMALTSGERTALTGVVWNALTSGLGTAGSIGKLVKDNLDATISSRNAVAPDNATIASTKTELDTVKAKTDNLPADPASQSAVAALIGALPSASTVAGAVWSFASRTLTRSPRSED